MASYRNRLILDLDRWVSDGLVPEASREPILNRLGPDRRIEPAIALAYIGCVLLGFAIIAFVASQWGHFPRMAQFILLMVAFLIALGGGAYAHWKGRLIASDALVTVAGLIFAAAIGLSGQIFELTGSPQIGLLSSGLAAAVLALAGRSQGAAILALGLIHLALGSGVIAGQPALPAWIGLLASALAIALALNWQSSALAHAAGLSLPSGFWWALQPVLSILSAADPGHGQIAQLNLAALLALFAFLTTRLTPKPQARILFGWALIGMIGAFIAAGFMLSGPWQIAHRLAWLLLSAGLIALGRADRHRPVLGLGVVSLLLAVGLVLTDLGLNLEVAAALLAIAAVVALGSGFAMRRRLSR